MEAVTMRCQSILSSLFLISRRIVLENSSGNTVDSTKVKVLLAVKAEKSDIDIKGASLRVNGKNVRENKHVKVSNFMKLIYSKTVSRSLEAIIRSI